MLLMLPCSDLAARDSPEKRANALYNEGKALMGQGELRQALEKFTAAWAAYRHPLIMKKRGEVRERLSEYEEAIEDYRRYLAALKGAKRNERRKIEERIAALEALLTKPVTVTVVATRPGVLVAVDAEKPRPTPFDIDLIPGKHQATIADPRFLKKTMEVRVTAGRPTIARLDAVPRTGGVVITTDRSSFDDTQVALDSETLVLKETERSRAQLGVRQLVVGKHSLVSTVPGRPSFYKEFVVDEAATVTVVCEFAIIGGGDPIRDPWGWVTAGSGIVAAGVGAGLLVSYALDVGTADDLNTDADPNNDVELVTNKDVFGAVFLGVGAALGVASYFVFTRNSVSTPAPTSFIVLPQRGGAFVGTMLRF